jgi:putative restriction endonuclease
MAFSEVEDPVQALLDEFGPPHPTSVGYPFHHLTNDDHLWQVRTAAGEPSPGSSVGVLRASAATGELDSEFAAVLLANPELLVRVARCMLETNFPPTLHDDIVSAVGLNLDELLSNQVVELTGRRRRNPAFRERVLLAYEARCAMCGWEGRLSGDAVGVEAAHVRWFTIDGPDALDNGLCLCSLHHKLFDLGAIGITPDHTVDVSLRFVGHGDIAEQLVYGLIGRELERPQAGLPRVAGAHIVWHNEQVFRAPSRSTA